MSQKVSQTFGNTCKRDKKILKDINEVSRPFPRQKRAHPDSDASEPTADVEAAPPQSDDKRLTKLEICDVMTEELA